MSRPSTFSLRVLTTSGEVVEVGIDGERLAVGFERVLVVADVLQDQAKAGQRAEMARFANKHLANVEERMAVILVGN